MKSRETQKSKELETFFSFSKIMDDYYIDPILGLITGAGDLISSILSLYSLRIAFKLKSSPLFIAMLFNILLDLLIGLIPVAGTIGDFFYKSNIQNYQLAEGYIRKDQKIRKSINKRAVVFAGGILAMLFLIFKVWEWSGEVWSYLAGIF